MSPLRIGVIGCGQIARGIHLPVLGRIPDARVVALAEPVQPSRDAAAAMAPRATAFTDYREMLAAGGLDAWRRARTVGMMGFNFRFHPQTARIKQRLSDGDIGTPLGVRSVFTILPHELPEWKRARSSGGGVLLDLASHHVDLVQYLLGEPVARVYASTRSLRGEGDHAAVQLELASGAMAQIFVSLGTVDENRMEIVGTSGKLVMDRTELLRPDHVPATQQGARARRLRRALSALEPRLVLRSPGFEPSFDAALRAFVWSASGNAFAGPDIADGMANLAVIEAAERSAASGASVALGSAGARPETPPAVPSSIR